MGGVEQKYNDVIFLSPRREEAEEDDDHHQRLQTQRLDWIGKLNSNRSVIV